MQTPEITKVLKLFHLDEAREVLPIVKKITGLSHQRLTPIQARLNKMLANDPRRRLYEHDYEQIVSQWKNKIERLGAQTIGLWLVEFELGDGCLSWRYPELSLAYFRQHGKSFAERIKLEDYIEENDPDWAH